MKTILSHATLIDCVNPVAVADTSVVIVDGRISAIHAGAAPPDADAQVIDLKGAWLLPGLWDVHIHPDYLTLNDMPLAEQVTLFGHKLMAALTESGITGMRCAGAHHYMDVAWKRAIRHRAVSSSGHQWRTSRAALQLQGRDRYALRRRSVPRAPARRAQQRRPMAEQRI